MIVLLACADSEVAAEAVPLNAEVWVERLTGAGGTLVLQTTWDPGGEVELPEPGVDGLRFGAPGEPERERLGRSEVLTVRWPFTGSPGSYEIPAMRVGWDGPTEEDLEILTDPVFVDLGVEPPRVGEIADIRDPSRVWTVPWLALATTMVVAGLLGAGVGVAFRLGRRRPVALPAEPPDVVAIRRWEAVRGDPSLDDMGKAIGLARIWREYSEAVLAFPATAWTTSEILDRLGGMPHLPEGNVPRARRILRATDRVKFAGVRAAADLFEELDADLRAFVGTTRPHNWGPP